MSKDENDETPFFQRIVDIGAQKQFSATEIRYLRVTNITSVLGTLFMAVWMIIAIYLTDSTIV